MRGLKSNGIVLKLSILGLQRILKDILKIQNYIIHISFQNVIEL